jgi:hypothetical protein
LDDFFSHYFVFFLGFLRKAFKSAPVIFFLLPATAANFFCFGEYLL